MHPAKRINQRGPTSKNSSQNWANSYANHMTSTPDASPDTSSTLPHEAVEKLAPGSPVTLAYRKYDGTPHWTHRAFYVGHDPRAHWIGAVKDEIVRKPGRELPWANHWVVAIPRNEWFTMNVNLPGPSVPTQVYCDMTSVPTWHQVDGGVEARAIDLDLDVMVLKNGNLIIDDEDEFEEHQVSYGYPQDVIDAARASCNAVHASLDADDTWFWAEGQAWLNRWISMIAKDPAKYAPAG